MAALDPVAYLRATPPFNGLPQPLFDLAAGALESATTRPARAGARRRATAQAPLRHPQGRGPARARRADAPGARGGRDLRLHLADHRQGHARRASWTRTCSPTGSPATSSSGCSPTPGSPATSPWGSRSGSRAAWSTRRWPPSRPTCMAGGASCCAGPPSGSRPTPPWARRPGSCAASRSRRCWSAASRPASSPTATSATGCWPSGLGPETPVTRSSPGRCDRGGQHAHLRGLDRAARRRRPPPPGHPRRREIARRPHLHRPARATPRGRWRCCAAWSGWPIARACPATPRKVTEMVAALLAGGLEPGGHRRLRGPAQRRAAAAPAPLGRGRPGRAARSLRLAGDRVGGAAGADPPHRPGQRAGLRRRGGLVAASTSRRSPTGSTPTSPRPASPAARAATWPGTTAAPSPSGAIASPAGWADPSAEGVLEAAIFFDFRRVAGSLDLTPLQDVLDGIPRRDAFLRSLVRQALDFRPPPLLVLRLRSGTDLDLKRQGIAPVVFLARCYGLAVGSQARSTLERLRAATRAGLMGPEASAAVIDSYRYLLGLRLRMQLEGHLGGQGPHQRDLALEGLRHRAQPAQGLAAGHRLVAGQGRLPLPGGLGRRGDNACSSRRHRGTCPSTGRSTSRRAGSTPARTRSSRWGWCPSGPG